MLSSVNAAKDEPALELRNVSKRFPGVRALDDVSLTIRRGEIHAIIGQNGAGKSTMINVISGMIAPDGGEIAVAGRSVRIDSTRAALELGIATVYQELSLLPNLTIAQNLALGREPRRCGFLDRQRMAARAREALGHLGLDIAPEAPVSRLSLPERQMVEVAKAV